MPVCTPGRPTGPGVPGPPLGRAYSRQSATGYVKRWLGTLFRRRGSRRRTPRVGFERSEPGLKPTKRGRDRAGPPRSGVPCSSGK
eukprot:9517184-Alexandrium_andersonii.AAC.1